MLPGGCVLSDVPPVATVQVCVVDEAGLGEFKALVASVAKEERIEVKDQSSERARQYAWLAKNEPKFQYVEPVTDLFGKRRDGFGIWAQSMQQQSYNIFVGFLPGHDRDADRELTDDVIERFAEKWVVRRLKENEGAFPLDGCDNPPPGELRSHKR